MKTQSLVLAGLVSVLPLCAFADNAQGFKLNTGVYVDEGDPLLGIAYEYPLSDKLAIVPGFEYVFVDNGDLYTFNVDSRFELDTNTQNPMWAGIGMGAIRREVGNFDDTDFGVNLMWGMDFDRGQNWMPYLSTKAVLSDDSYFMVGFGIRFGNSSRAAPAN